MWDAQFLLVQLPVVLREFCMGGCRCELKKMGRCWRNWRCCECEWKNWIVEHFLSCSKNNYWWKFYSAKNLFWALCARVSIWGADLNDVENAVSFRKYLLMIRALTWYLFLFPLSWHNWLEKHWESFAILTRKSADLLHCALGTPTLPNRLSVAFSGRSYNNCIDCLSFDSWLRGIKSFTIIDLVCTQVCYFCFHFP